MKGISLDLLKTFVTFASSDNMSETAQKLGISQPAVTFQLKKLEEELPAAIFSSSGNRKILTHFGKALYQVLDPHFSDVELSLTKLNNLFANPENYTFKIGGRKEVLSRILPKLNSFGTLEVLNLNEEEIVHGLVAHKIDIGITFEEINRADVFHKKLFTDQGLFCIHRKLLGGQRFSPSMINDIKFLTQTPVVAYNRKFPYLREWIEACGGKVGDLKVRCIYEDWNDIVKLVGEGHGYSIIPSKISIPYSSEDFITYEIPTSVIPASSFYAFFHQELQEMGIIEKMFSRFISG